MTPKTPLSEAALKKMKADMDLIKKQHIDSVHLHTQQMAGASKLVDDWAAESPLVNKVIKSGSPFDGSWNTGHAKPSKKKLANDSAHIKLLKVGADVEIFLFNPASGKPVPVVGLIGGTKESPMPVIREGYALQEDNVALEYNIPASSTSLDFVYSLMRIREEIDERLKKMNLVAAVQSSMRFDEKQLESDQARIFGCDPDFNAWEKCVNEKPSASPEAKTLRTAGGHVHVSFAVNHKEVKYPENLAEAENVIMALDAWLGVPFVFVDKDVERRKMYGKAGAFRPKPYGVEYRVLGPIWTSTPDLMQYTFEQVQRAIRYVNVTNNPKECLLDMRELIVGAINDGDKDKAMKVVQYFGIDLPALAA